LLCGLVLGACGGNHRNQPYYQAGESGGFFADGKTMQDPPENTVPRGLLAEDAVLYTGRSRGAFVQGFPFPVTAEVLDRGQERYEISCAPCHGDTGAGDGVIVRRGYPAPPTYHQDRLRTAPPGYLFDVITNGFGGMPSYAYQVEPRDRWAIVAYIRALQLSQNAPPAVVPPAQREELNNPSGGEEEAGEAEGGEGE